MRASTAVSTAPLAHSHPAAAHHSEVMHVATPAATRAITVASIAAIKHIALIV
jgi:hypothetical protein